MGRRRRIWSSTEGPIYVGSSPDQRLPTYYLGQWIWPKRNTWVSLFSAYEARVGRAIRDNLSAGDTFWDIGANFGWFSLFAAKIVQCEGKVCSFEPSPEVFDLLRSNVRGLDRVQAFQCGLGNADGISTFASQGISTAASFIEDVTRINARHWPQVPIRNVEVRMRKADSLARELGHLPNLAKIDVEGFEFEVLQGAAGLLSTSRPTLVIEVHPPQLELSGGSDTLLLRFLRQNGYEWEIIDQNANSLYWILAKCRRATVSCRPLKK